MGNDEADAAAHQAASPDAMPVADHLAAFSNPTLLLVGPDQMVTAVAQLVMDTGWDRRQQSGLVRRPWINLLHPPGQLVHCVVRE